MSEHENSSQLKSSGRSQLRRRPGRGSRDRNTVNAILDEALVAHIGFIDAGAPTVIPATPWRIGDWLYLHGAANGRLVQLVGAGAPVSVSVALVDGLVFARSAMRHSCDYRSVVLFGTGEAVTDPASKSEALLRLVDRLSPGRSGQVRPPDEKELAATGVVRLKISEGAAKIRQGPPTVVDKDAGWTVWTGIVPVAMRAGSPQPAEDDDALAPPALWPWLRT
jgi:uncharacterized protein